MTTTVGQRPAIPVELLRQIRRIEIRVRRLLNTAFLGEYHSVFRGQGMEFADVREYQPGDDVRTIDWNVTARSGFPYIKQFVEERELTVLLAVDVSSSGTYGSTGQTKQEVATEVAALLAFSAIRNGDKVGLVTFTDRVEAFLEPSKGQQHVLRLLRELLFNQPKGKGTDINAALRFISQIQRRRCVVFLISDFLTEGYEATLRVAARRHDVVAIILTDPREAELPEAGIVTLEDAETGAQVVVDTGDPAVRAQLYQLALDARAQRNNTLNALKVDHLEVQTDTSYVEPLAGFFKSRARRA